MLIYAIMCIKTKTAQMAGHHAATLMVPPFKNCKLTYIVKIFRGAARLYARLSACLAS